MFEVFKAMKYHWTSDYDFIKFKGRIKGADRVTFDRHSDSKIFHTLNKKHKIEKDFVMMLIPLFMEDQQLHPSFLLTKKAEEKALLWYRKIQNLQRIFSDDCDKVTSFIKDQGMTYQQFFLGDPVIDFLLYEEINPETFIILDKVLFFLKKNKKDSIIFTDLYESKINNYSAFINVEREKYKKLFEKSVKRQTRSKK